MLIMGTRAAAFTAKIRNLHDYQLRLLHGIMPVPSGVDIANTIKYFTQTLLTVLKDVPSSPLEMLKCQEKDSVRLGLFPNLDYKGVYNAIVQLTDVAPLIQYGLYPFGMAMLQCLGCLLPFLEHEMIDSLPYLVASSMAVLPTSLHQEIVNSLCFYILPFTIIRGGDKEQENYANQSVASVIMMVFQYSENPAHHCQLLECLMTTKKDVVRDLMCVIAYGTPGARSSATKLLFYYWPTFNPDLFDRRVVLQKFTTDFVPFVCQRDMCPNAGSAEAAKVCYDHCISITFSSDSPPPLYLCIECANEIHREHPNQMFFDILHPMQQVSMTCENKNCRATDKYAYSICFSTECASYNGNHPIRYCQQCHNFRHNNRRGGDHIIHMSLPQMWVMDAEMQTYMVEAIVSLLKEAKISESFGSKDTSDMHSKSLLLNPPTTIEPGQIEERQMLGRYGVWLLVGLCTPNQDTSIEVLGRLLSILFHWFDVTTVPFDEPPDNILERLKLDFVCNWLTGVSQTHFEVFVSCLLPHPPDYARVGGHWDTLVSRTSHLKHGLSRMFSLVHYDIITTTIWDYVMPHWMEAIINDVPERELNEVKILLSKMLDPDLSPLGFDAKKLYNFVALRFAKTSAKVQEQALCWLKTLTCLEIVIPLHLLFSMFGEGVDSLKELTSDAPEDKPARPPKMEDIERIAAVVDDESGNTSGLSDDEIPTSRHVEFEADNELNITCCILMLDVLLRQLELQEVEKHNGVNTALAQDVWRLLKLVLLTPWVGVHTCTAGSGPCGGGGADCHFCETCVMCYQLALQLVKFLAPVAPVRPPDPPEEPYADDYHGRKSPPESDKKSDSKPDVVINMPIPEIHGLGGVLIMTATVETVTEQLDLAAIIPAEKVVAAVARAVTLTDTDVATAKVQVARANLVGENDQPIDQDSDDDLNDFWQTSVGKFRFSIDELPQLFQFIHQLLTEIPNTSQPDVLYYMLQCLNVIVLHGDAFTKAAKDHRGFFIWSQENILIQPLWGLCNAEHSHICEVTVPLLLHCITLPSGSDVFWRLIQEEFHNEDWRVRFTAVERVTVIARFMDSTPLRSVLPLQAALANSFCYLISSMDDINVYVAQRATLYLGTIHDNAVQSLILCLETQFDSVIVDRPMVLQSLYQLHNSLGDRNILTWEFFLNRFDTLFIEAQVALEKAGDISILRDLRNTDLSSEAFLRKLSRAQEVISQQSDSSSSSGVKTLSASFGPKWPYKRTMSAPASMAPRPDVKQEKEKEKVYNRQYSAPILKRKSSRFGLGQFLGSIPPTNSTSLPDGQIHSLSAGDDAHLVNSLHRVIELEQTDRETIHLLVFLLLQFLSRSDQAHPTDDRFIAKTQTILLKHLFLLLGHNQNDRTFHIAPTKLRSSSVFHVFLANLPQVLDQNHLMGWMFVPSAMLVLQYCPRQQQGPLSQVPTYSLWYLEPNTRHSWLMAVVVLLYKYNYSHQPICSQILSLIRIVLNTLDSQHHVCRRIPTTVLMGQQQSSRSRDVSQPSLGGEGGDQHGDKFDTPPLSPLYGTVDERQHVSINTKPGKAQALYHQKSHGAGSMETHWEEEIPPYKLSSKSRKHPESSFSIDADDTESELAAIPESPCSDSTIHNSFEELVNLDESCGLLNLDSEPAVASQSASVATHWAAENRATVVESKAVVIENKPIVMESKAVVKEHKPTLMDSKSAVVESKALVMENKPLVIQTPVIIESKPVVVENKPTAVSTKPFVIESRTIHKVKPDNKPSRPMWFLGSEEDDDAKYGIKEGVKMLMSSTLVSQFYSKKNKIEAPPTSPGPSSRRIDDEATASTSASTSAPLSAPEKPEAWPELSEHGSPIPRPLGRPKPLQAPPPQPPPLFPSPFGAHHVPWQIDHHRPLAAPMVERLLPIGNNQQRPAVGSRNVPQPYKSEDIYGSPESPLSKMDVMTIGSPADSETNASSSTCSASQLEFPQPERLLPIGPNEGFTGLVEKVKQSIGLPPDSPPSAGAQRPTELDPRIRPTYVKQESYEKMEAKSMSPLDDIYASRGASPRRLIKQTALDSSPPQTQLEGDEHSAFYRGVHHERKPPAGPSHRTEEPTRTRSQKNQQPKKTGGLFSMGQNLLSDFPRRPGSWYGSEKQPFLDTATQQACHAEFDLKQSSFRIGDDCVVQRCPECGAVKEEYSDEELGLCIIILSTFVHREPALAAPLLPEILSTVSTIAVNPTYPWQTESNIYLPGGAMSVAHQFLRCVLHQLAPNGIFVQMFLTHVEESNRQQFFRSVAQALLDFNELNPIAPLQLVLENLNTRKVLPSGDQLGTVLHNMACYLDCLPLEAGLGPGPLLQQLELLFRRLSLNLTALLQVEPLLKIMVAVLKVPGISAYKGILDPFSKVISYSIQNFVMKYHYLVDLCYLCSRSFTREREKLLLSRMVVFELVQALKFKTILSDANFLMLINFVLQDAGGALPPSVVIETSPTTYPDPGLVLNTNASECMRQHLADVLEFLADFHTLSKIKSYCNGSSVGLNEDTIGGVLKCGIAQYLALEMTRGNGRDNRAVARYLPWLYNAPAALQQNPKEFVECLGHIRLLSWLLLGSLTHVALLSGPTHATCSPIPQEASCHIADHVQVILAGFAEQSKASVLHMSSLFHAFILCQLWTVYLEQGAAHTLPNTEGHTITMSVLFDFWGKVTPCILQLVSHSKVLAEMVNLHFLSLLEGLLECNSTLLSKLLPMWSPVLFSHHIQLPGHLQVRLQGCRNFPPSTPPPVETHSGGLPVSNPILLRWLQRLQFKMGQIEVQSSAATQFYSV